MYAPTQIKVDINGATLNGHDVLFLLLLESIAMVVARLMVVILLMAKITIHDRSQ